MKKVLGGLLLIGVAGLVWSGVRRRRQVAIYRRYVGLTHVYIGRIELGDVGAPFRVYANQDLPAGQVEALLNDETANPPLLILLQAELAGKMIYVLGDGADLILRLVGT